MVSHWSGKFIVGATGVAGLALVSAVSLAGRADSSVSRIDPAPVAVASAPVAAPAPATPLLVASGSADTSACEARGWPYTGPGCNVGGTRQVRVISTSRDAPRAVPLPVSAQPAAIVSVAIAQADQVTSAKPILLASQSVQLAPDAVAIDILPPARPEIAAATTASAVEVTGSVEPVAAPAKRQVARARVARTKRFARARERRLDQSRSSQYAQYIDEPRYEEVRPHYDYGRRWVSAEVERPTSLFGWVAGPQF